MKKIMRGSLLAMLILAMCLTLMCPVFAADAITVEMPVTVTNSGYELEEPETYKIVLKADDASFPMPKGSENGEYTLEVTGPGEAAFPAITYAKHGTYTYTAWQVAGENELGTYDDAKFNITVYITNKEDYSGLMSTVAVYKDGESEKQTIEFGNSYEEPIPDVEITVVKKWVDDAKGRPDSITVQLLENGKVAETVTLNEFNKWTHTWGVLSGESEWDVKEANVPKGYTASYETNGTVVTITNTEKLIQTGQLNWPIVVFAGLGVVVLAAGLLLIFKKREGNNAA